MTPDIDITMESMHSKNYSAGEMLTAEDLEISSFYTIVKRLMDIVCSLLGMVALSWLFLIISIAIFADDPHGSPFYSQTRIGKNGRSFRLWKFRSMVVGAEEMKDDLQEHNEKDGPVFKIKDDPRITRVGRFIRKTSIDELPQLWNVLKGDMSIVGPRPPLPSEVKKYNDYHRQRLMITPGLTCFWQTTPQRDDISFDDWVALDLKYIRNRNLWLDIKLILRTVVVVFTGQGN